MKLETWAGVWFFAIVMTSMAMISAASLSILYFERQYHALVVTPALMITAIIAFPLCFLFGSKVKLNTELAHELKRLVNRDRLTDVATRDYFFKQLSENAELSGVTLMIDVDHFKSINDTYGHLTGDKVIAHTAKMIERHVRARDIVCRFGGEEFVVFLAECDERGALDLAERIRAEIDDSDYQDRGQTVAVTVSIGCSVRSLAGKIETSIRHADDALYKAKALGRNQVVMADWSASGVTEQDIWDDPSARSRSA